MHSGKGKPPVVDEAPMKRSLALASSLYTYSFCNKFEEEKILEFLDNESLNAKIERVGSCIESAYFDCRKELKEGLQENRLDLQEMIARNSKIKEIF